MTVVCPYTWVVCAPKHQVDVFLLNMMFSQLLIYVLKIPNSFANFINYKNEFVYVISTYIVENTVKKRIKINECKLKTKLNLFGLV